MSLLKKQIEWVVTEQETAIVPYGKSELDTTAEIVDGEVLEDTPLRTRRPIRVRSPRERQLEIEVETYKHEQQIETEVRRQRRETSDHIQRQKDADDHREYLKWEKRRQEETRLEAQMRSEQFASSETFSWFDFSITGLFIFAVAVVIFIAAKDSTLEQILQTIYSIIAIAVLVAIGWIGVKLFKSIF